MAWYIMLAATVQQRNFPLLTLAEQSGDSTTDSARSSNQQCLSLHNRVRDLISIEWIYCKNKDYISQWSRCSWLITNIFKSAALSVCQFERGIQQTTWLINQGWMTVGIFSFCKYYILVFYISKYHQIEKEKRKNWHDLMILMFLFRFLMHYTQ